MRVTLQRLPNGEFALPIPDTYIPRAGWREGDEVVVNCVHGGSMLSFHPWTRRPADRERQTEVTE